MTLLDHERSLLGAPAEDSGDGESVGGAACVTSADWVAEPCASSAHPDLHVRWKVHH